MPTSVGGDVFKMVKLGQKIGNQAHAFSATFMERFTGVVALVIVSYYGLFKTLGFWIEQLPPEVSANTYLLLAFKILLFIGFWVAAAVGFLTLKVLSTKISIFEKIYRSLIALSLIHI